MYLLENLVAALAASNIKDSTASGPPKFGIQPTPIPRPPRLCGNGPFVNNATSSSPLVGDCLRLTEFFEYTEPWTYNFTKDVRFTNIASYKSCMMGIRSVVGDASFNLEDRHALLLAATKGLKNEDQIEGTTEVDCGGVEVEWAVYTTRNSPFLV